MLNLKWVSVVQNDYIIENIHSLFLLNCQFCRKNCSYIFVVFKIFIAGREIGRIW
jgi:hypothetical protein